ncbi:hypothetical protein N0V92_012906 [Colletotrichum tropicale]|nr:hypothetical protein N0V92_012906 [Colletotrichum tropicale]
MAPKRKRKATVKTSQAPKDPAVTCLTEKGAASNYLQVLPGEGPARSTGRHGIQQNSWTDEASGDRRLY